MVFTILDYLVRPRDGTVEVRFVEQVVGLRGPTYTALSTASLPDGVGALASPGWTDADVAAALAARLGVPANKVPTPTRADAEASPQGPVP